MSKTENGRSIFESTMNELATMRDELKLRAHLLGMEAQTQWEQAQVKLTDLEGKAEREGEKAAEALLERARNLKEQMKTLLDDKPKV